MRISTNGAPTLVNCTINLIVPNGDSSHNKPKTTPTNNPVRESLANLNTFLSGLGYQQESSQSVIVDEEVVRNTRDNASSSTFTRDRSFHVSSTRYSSKRNLGISKKSSENLRFGFLRKKLSRVRTRTPFRSNKKTTVQRDNAHDTGLINDVIADSDVIKSDTSSTSSASITPAHKQTSSSPTKSMDKRLGAEPVHASKSPQHTSTINTKQASTKSVSFKMSPPNSSDSDSPGNETSNPFFHQKHITGILKNSKKSAEQRQPLDTDNTTVTDAGEGITFCNEASRQGEDTNLYTHYEDIESENENSIDTTPIPAPISYLESKNGENQTTPKEVVSRLNNDCSDTTSLKIIRTLSFLDTENDSKTLLKTQMDEESVHADSYYEEIPIYIDSDQSPVLTTDPTTNPAGYCERRNSIYSGGGNLGTRWAEYEPLPVSVTPSDDTKAKKKRKIYAKLNHSPRSRLKRTMNREKWEKRHIDTAVHTEAIYDEWPYQTYPRSPTRDGTETSPKTHFNMDFTTPIYTDPEEVIYEVPTDVIDNKNDWECSTSFMVSSSGQETAPKKVDQNDITDPTYINSGACTYDVPPYLLIHEASHYGAENGELDIISETDSSESDYENNDDVPRRTS